MSFGFGATYCHHQQKKERKKMARNALHSGFQALRHSAAEIRLTLRGKLGEFGEKTNEPCNRRNHTKRPFLPRLTNKPCPTNCGTSPFSSFKSIFLDSLMIFLFRLKNLSHIPTYLIFIYDCLLDFVLDFSVNSVKKGNFCLLRAQFPPQSIFLYSLIILLPYLLST